MWLYLPDTFIIGQFFYLENFFKAKDSTDWYSKPIFISQNCEKNLDFQET